MVRGGAGVSRGPRAPSRLPPHRGRSTPGLPTPALPGFGPPTSGYAPAAFPPPGFPPPAYPPPGDAPVGGGFPPSYPSDQEPPAGTPGPVDASATPPPLLPTEDDVRWSDPVAGDTGNVPGRKRSRRRSLITAVSVIVVVALIVGGGVAYLITSGPGPVPRVSPAARSLLRSALSASTRKGSFHYVSRSESQGITQTTVGDAATNAGKQVITIGHDTFTVLVIGSACYFKGDTREMVQQLGLSVTTATAHNGAWISLAPSDGPYASVYAAVTTHSALADNIDFVPHRRLGTTVRSGTKVMGMTGPLEDFKVAGVTQKAKGTAYLYVASAKPHLPVQYSERGTISGQRSSFTMTFGHWGEHVDVTAPTGAISYGSLGAQAVTPSGPPSLV